jgi:GNAT superfamily N-acetyltransferase
MLKIRPATASDVPLLVSLIRELANYELRPHTAVVKEEDLLRDGFGPQPKFRALLADCHGQPAGYALFFYFYSTFAGRPALFLEDLFVLEPFRGQGVGHALLASVAALALEEHCIGLRWEVLDWNRPAIEFYERLGASFLKERRVAAFDREALRRFVGEDLIEAGAPKGSK